LAGGDALEHGSDARVQLHRDRAVRAGRLPEGRIELRVLRDEEEADAAPLRIVGGHLPLPATGIFFETLAQIGMRPRYLFRLHEALVVDEGNRLERGSEGLFLPYRPRRKVRGLRALVVLRVAV